MSEMVEYVKVLEEEIDVWHTVAQQRDVPHPFQQTIRDLEAKRNALRAKVGVEIDAFKAANQTTAKHGQLG